MPSAVSDLKTRMLELSAPDTDGVLRGGTAKRAVRTALAMDALAQLWNEAAQAVPFDVPSHGVALAAVGSLARGQIGPASDLDLVLISDGHTLGRGDQSGLFGAHRGGVRGRDRPRPAGGDGLARRARGRGRR